MFVGLKTPQLEMEVRRLPIRERDHGNFPVLRVSSLLGQPFSFEACLVPTTPDDVVLLVSQEDADQTLKAINLNDVPQLISLEAVFEKLSQAIIAIGKDPMDVVAEAFGVKTRVEGVNAVLRYAAWWLRFGLAGEAHAKYMKSYQQLSELLRFVPGLQFANTDTVAYDSGQPENYYGESVAKLLELNRRELENELKAALNHDPVALDIEVVRWEHLQQRYSESGPAWEQYYGAKWGPFVFAE